MKTRSSANWDKQRKSLFQIIKKRLGLIIILLGIFIPVVSFFIGYFGGQMYSSGVFVQWHSLGTHPGKISKLLGICHYRLCVETVDQKIYISSLDCPFGLICPTEEDKTAKTAPWEEVGKKFEIEIPADMSCPAFIVANPPGKVVQSIEEKTCGGYHTKQTSYVLLQDGSVWSWDHDHNDEEDLFWYIFFGPIAAFIGFIVWVVIGIIFIWVDQRTNVSDKFSARSRNPFNAQNYSVHRS